MGARRVRARLHACCSPSSSPTPAGCGTGSTTGSRTGSRSTGPGRGEKEWYFYIVVLFAEEWPALLLGAVGAVATLRRPTLLRAFLIWDFVLSLAVYSLGERALLLARAAPAAAAAAARRPRRAGDLGRARALERPARARASCSSCALYTGYASWWANVENGADPREFLVTTQSAEQVKGVRDEVRRGRRARAARGARRAASWSTRREGATFPWAWYFRDLAAGYLDLTDAELPSDTDVGDPHRGEPRAAAAASWPATTAAASRSASGGCATTARCRRAAGGAGSRGASRGTRPAGCRSGSTCARALDGALRRCTSNGGIEGGARPVRARGASTGSHATCAARRRRAAIP